MIDKNILAIAGIMAITVLESVAMIVQQDGAYFGLIIATIAGLAGYSIAQQESIKVLASTVQCS